MCDLGSIPSLATLLAAESWIIKNPPEHGNTCSAGREADPIHSAKAGSGKEQIEKLVLTVKKQPTLSHSALGIGRNNTAFPASFFLSDETFPINPAGINTAL